MMVTYYKGEYFQGSLSDERADTLLKLHKYTAIESLRNIITNIPEETVNKIVKGYKKHIKDHKSFHQISLDDFGLSRADMPIGELRDMQTVGVAFMYYAESCIIGDEVGLGKTVQVAGYTNLMRKDFVNKGKKFRYLFLAEKSSAVQIHAKMVQFTGDYVHFFPSATQSVLDKELAYKGIEEQSIVGTHALLQNADFITFCIKHPFDLIIVDESRILKNRNSTAYKNMTQLRKVVPNIVLLNATPLETELSEFYNQLRILEEDYVPKITEFEARYVKKRLTSLGAQPDGYKNQEEFANAISLRYMARTRESEGATFLDNHMVKVLIEPSPEQKTLLRKSTLKSMTMDYPTSVDKLVNFDEEAAPKLGALLTLLKKEVKQDNKSVLIYVRYRECQDALKEELSAIDIDAEIVNGDQKYVKDRQETIERFNNKEFNVLITNIVRGIDMNTATTAIIYSIYSNPQDLNQFIGRMTRDFHVNNKTVYMLIYDGYEVGVLNDKLNFRLTASKELTITGRSLLHETIKAGKTYRYVDEQFLELE